MPTNPLANLMKRSPFKGLQEHMRVVLECVHEVPPLFKSLCDGDQAGVQAAKERIFEKENVADDIKNDLRAHLPNSLFMPVDRRDLLEVLHIQDSIADTAQDIARLFIERPMEVPAPLSEPLRALAEHCIETCEQASRIIEELDELVETGFRGPQASRVASMLDELNRIEHETDELQLELTRLLFRHEDDMNPVSVILWLRIIEWVGDLADLAEQVGDRLRLMIAR